MGILGLRDTASYASDRFQNWRRTILYSFPNGAAPLTAFLSLTEPEGTNDPHFNWYQKPLPTQRSVLTGSYSGVATSIAVAEANFRVGHQLLNEATNEVMEVTGVSSDGLTLTVHRGEWGAAAASSGADDAIVIIGNINAEGGGSPQAISVDPTPKTNITQIFRSPLELTGTAMQTALKYDRTGPYKERLREALNFHSIEMEKAFLFGKYAEWNDPADGKLKRTTRGILDFLPAGYKVTPADAGGVMTLTEWEDFAELAFRVCSNSNSEKLVLLGSGALKAVNRLAQQQGEMKTVAGDEAFGMALNRWHTPYGTLYLRTHPLFTQHPVWRYTMLILDVHNLHYRYVNGRDTTRLTNRQANDADSRKDEFLTECGLEVHHYGVGATAEAANEGTHLLITNVRGADVS